MDEAIETKAAKLAEENTRLLEQVTGYCEALMDEYEEWERVKKVLEDFLPAAIEGIEKRLNELAGIGIERRDDYYQAMNDMRPTPKK